MMHTIWPELSNNRLERFGVDDDGDGGSRLLAIDSRISNSSWSRSRKRNEEYLKAKPNCPMTTANYS